LLHERAGAEEDPASVVWRDDLDAVGALRGQEEFGASPMLNRDALPLDAVSD
jgi:hypothetical protein